MFEGFKKKTDPGAKSRYAMSAGVSVFFYAAIAAAAIVVGGRVKKEVQEEKPVDVVFRPPPPPEEAPPPPPKLPKKAAPPPIIPEGMKTKVVENLPPPAELVQPNKIPDKKLAEGNAADDAIAISPHAGKGQAGGYEGGTGKEPAPPAPPPPPKRAEPQNLPEDAEPAVECADNDHDGDKYYPTDAKAKGLEGKVILKYVITDKGRVDNIQVLKGEEPFVSGAISMVKTWCYTPAKLDGNPIAVFKILTVPFKLR